MVPGHCSLGGAEDLIHSLYNAVRREASVLYAQIHTSPCGMKAHSKRSRSRKLGIRQTVIRTLWEYIVMIKAGRTSGFQKLPHTGQGAVVYDLFIQIFPDLIQRFQPWKQFHFLDLRQIPAERLIKMVMCIDQPGIHDHCRGINDLLRPHFLCFPVLRCDSIDHTVPDQNIYMTKDPVFIVTGDKISDILQQ